MPGTLVADELPEETLLQTTAQTPHIPDYLERHYWWAYVRPWAIRFWDRRWLVNAILFGFFDRLRDRALARLGKTIPGKLVQIAAVYGDLSPKIYERMAEGAEYHLVDVTPAQLANVARKLPADHQVRMHVQDSTALQFKDGSFDTTLIFFLPHEQPDDIKRQTFAEALRITKPGGRILFVEFHKPAKWHPWFYWYRFFLMVFEPFALAMWRSDLRDWFPADAKLRQTHKETLFGGLYQVVEFAVDAE